MKKSQLRVGTKYRIIGNGNQENCKTHHHFSIGSVVTAISIDHVFEGIDSSSGRRMTQYVDREHIAPLLKLELI